MYQHCEKTQLPVNEQHSLHQPGKKGTSSATGMDHEIVECKQLLITLLIVCNYVIAA